jgi:putative ABC transport system substrate-binding protein
LRDLGWIEGRTVAIEHRWAEGRRERFAEIATELVRLKVDIIVTAGTAPTLAAKQATSIIPIVFAAAGDPVAGGLVASLARPGGNVTGLSVQATDLAGKRLELLQEVVPGLRRLAVLANVHTPLGGLQIEEVHTAARTLRFEVVPVEIRRADDIAPAIAARATWRRFMSPTILSSSCIGFASARWRLSVDCRQCMAHGSMSKPEA